MRALALRPGAVKAAPAARRGPARGVAGGGKTCAATIRLARVELLRARTGERSHSLSAGFRAGRALCQLPLELIHGLGSFFGDSGFAPSLLTS